jgi:sugar lactone lactonase YvrE
VRPAQVRTLSPPAIPSRPPEAFAYSTGNRIAATRKGALVTDADSGALLAIDEAGTTGAQLAIGRDVGQLVFDPEREVAFVADRMGDRIVVVDARMQAGAGLHQVAAWRTPAEPFGVALTPDRQTLLVTTVADRTLVALDSATGAERWRVPIVAGARGVSVSPDGMYALIGSIAVGSVDFVEISGAHRVATVPLELRCPACEGNYVARGTGTVMFLDGRHAIATLQRSVPEVFFEVSRSHYGGGRRPPVTQHVTLFTLPSDSSPSITQELFEGVHQGRGVAWDTSHHALYVGGHGSDELGQYTNITRTKPGDVDAALGNLGGTERCGPDGLALARNGDLLAWCAFSRRVMRVASHAPDLGAAKLSESAPLVASAFTEDQHAGLELFYGANSDIDGDKLLTCSTCHLQGLSDGLSWRIKKQELQTPILAGRLTGTHPFKWDGSDKTLAASITSTVTRLGGRGLSAAQTAQLESYLLALPRPRTPTRDPAIVARGKAVFEGAAGCTACHDGAAYVDNRAHAFADSVLKKADTPSLIGLASSAPYFHDGSSASIDDLLYGGGTVKDMVDFSKLSVEERSDLRAYLESL